MIRVLIVDCKPENLYLLRALLQGHGYEVVEARHGAEALAKARQSPPSLVISDLLMPVMDGYTLLRQWKADERLCNIPFIVYTATYTEPKDEQLAIDLGADAFILKPAEPGPFLDCMRHVLAESAAGRLSPAKLPKGDAQGQLEEYNETLIRKLEKRALQLERTNQELKDDIAGRERAEAALRESEEKFSAAFHANPTPLAITTMEGSFVDVNPAYTELVGRLHAEIIGKNAVDLGLVDTATRERMIEAMRASGGSLRNFEVDIHLANNIDRTILISSEVVSIHGVTHRLSSSADITERKKAQQEVIESEARYRALFENMSGGFVLFEVVVNEEGHPIDLVILAANVGFEGTTGLKRHEVIGQRLTHVLPGIEDDEAGWIQIYGHVALTGEPRQVENPSELLGRHYVVAAYQPVPNQCAVTFLDVTERKAAEAALRESEVRLRLSVTAADVGLWDWDMETNAIYYSPEWKHQIGYRDDEISNDFEEWRSRVHPDDLEPTMAGVQEFLADPKGRYVVEYRFRHKDGSYCWILSSSDALCDPKGKPIRMLGCHIDITERKHNEQELRWLTETLEQQVQERTADLQDRNEELDAFARTVSHDLRAPLRAIAGFADALREDYGPQLENAGHKFLDHIRNAALNMDQMIRDLLEYSRIGRANLKLYVIDLDSTIGEAIQQIQANIEQRNAVITVESPLHSVKAHPSTLRQVAVNLISNAMKFVAPGVQPKVRIWSESIGDTVRLWFEDNGIGIAAEHQDRIFQVFERLHGAEEYSGTGIGLAIARRAIERMGGRCGFESKPGQGSQFWIELPG